MSRGATKDQLLRSAPELFTQDALFWYRTGHFVSWDDLTSQLKEAFQPYDYEYTLWDEIRHRTQGAQERVLNFVTAMENLFRKLQQIPAEETRLNLIKRNLLPYIQMQLSIHPVSSVAELTRLSRAIEETETRVQKFIPPPTNYRNLLEPELAYRRVPTHQVAATVNAVRGPPVSQSPLGSAPASLTTSQTPVTSVLVPEVLTATNSATCWNCGRSGHCFRACDRSRKIFCFKCGRQNVTYPSCPNCPKNGSRGRH